MGVSGASENLNFGAAGLLEGVGELEDAGFAEGRAEDLQAYGELNGRSGGWRVASGERRTLRLVVRNGLG